MKEQRRATHLTRPVSKNTDCSITNFLVNVAVQIRTHVTFGMFLPAQEK